MTRTPRVPASDAVQIGSLLRDPAGEMYVVVRKRDDAYWTAELGDVQNFMDGGEMYEDRYAPEGWNDGDYPQALAGTAPAEMVAAVHEVNGRAAAIDAVMERVAPADARDLYNALASVHSCTGWMRRNPDSSPEQFLAIRARDVRRMEAITGSLSAAAVLLGSDEDTVRGYLNA